MLSVESAIMETMDQQHQEIDKSNQGRNFNLTKTL